MEQEGIETMEMTDDEAMRLGRALEPLLGAITIHVRSAEGIELTVEPQFFPIAREHVDAITHLWERRGV
jgi:hypothetical protein